MLKTWSRISVVRGFSASSPSVGLDPGHGGHEPFQIDERHPGIGTARQYRVELDRDALPSTRGTPARATGQIGEVAHAAIGIAHPQARQPAVNELGDVVVGRNQVGVIR